MTALFLVLFVACAVGLLFRVTRWVGVACLTVLVLVFYPAVLPLLILVLGTVALLF